MCGQPFVSEIKIHFLLNKDGWLLTLADGW
jgi:hypothetical protein